MKSIMQDNVEVCFLCGRNGSGDPLERHHVLGASNRKYSEEDGLTVYLCGNRCHRNGKYAAHRNKRTATALKELAQIAWESRYGDREAFLRRYGRNYLNL